MLAAWFVVSNSCAFAFIAGNVGVKGAGQTIRKCCNSHLNTPEKNRGVPGKVCCKALRILPLAPGGNVIAPPKVLPLFQLVWAIQTNVAADAVNGFSESDGTGPPQVRRFAELVLQRSLFVHAPPVFG